MSVVTRRRLVAGIGVLLAGAAGALHFEPSLLQQMSPLLSAIGNTYLLLVGVAAVAILQALREFLRGASIGVQHTPTPAVESFSTAPTPGVELDEAVHELCHTRGVRQTRDRDRIRDRLRKDAIGVLATKGEYSRDEAEAAVADGSWTDDRFAAAFVGGKDAPGPRFHQRVIASVARTPQFERQVHRTIQAISAVEDR